METLSIYLDLSARENLIQQFMTLGIPDNKGIQEILELVGLNSTGKRKAKDFSLGMRQRPGIAIALAVIRIFWYWMSRSMVWTHRVSLKSVS